MTWYFLTSILTFMLAFCMQYSVFGSIMTIRRMVGAILSGKIADIFGRRNVKSLNFSLVSSTFGHLVI